MSKLSLKWRVILIGNIPLFAFIAIVSMDLYQDYKNITHSYDVENQLELVELASITAHDLQKERGFAGRYALGFIHKDDFIEQKDKASGDIQNLIAYLPHSGFSKEYQGMIKSELNSLKKLRSDVLNSNLTPADIISSYSSIIMNLVHAATELRKTVDFSEINAELGSLLILEESKEFGGELREEISVILSKNKPVSVKKQKKLIHLWSHYSASLTSEGLTLDENETEVRDELLSSVGATEMEEYILYVIKKADVGNYDRDPIEFIKKADVQLDKLGKLLSMKSAHISKSIKKIEAANEALLIEHLSFIIPTFCFVVFFMLYSIKTLYRQLEAVSSKLLEDSQGLNSVSTQLAGSSEKLSEATAQQAASLQETVASADEISAMIARNSTNAKESAEMSSESKQSAHMADNAVQNMSTAINDIMEHNQEMAAKLEAGNNEIGEVVKVIREIANKTQVINDIVFQTKLLSFNASVEAARAGEHGKGFAVVAEEVGNLASMSGTAADEISDMLNSSLKRVEDIVEKARQRISTMSESSSAKVNEGMKTVTECKNSLNEIIECVVNIDGKVQQISESSNEQNLGIQEITKAMGELDTVTQSNSHESRGAATAAKEVQDRSENINRIVNELEVLLGRKRENTNSVVAKETKATVIPFPEKVKAPVNGSNGSNGVHKKVVGSDLPDWNDPDFEEI